MRQKPATVLILLLLLVAVLFFADICLGPVAIPFKDVWRSLTGNSASKETWSYIIVNYRLPKAIAAILAGTGLSVSGLLMQTLFRNPLAGPYVLGVSSGSSLGVAFIIMGAGLFPFFAELAGSAISLTVASCLGSSLVLALVVLVSARLRDTNAILIVGLMFGSFTSAIVGLLSWFGSAEQLQKFTFWSMGNLSNMSWDSIGILSFFAVIGLVMAAASIKSLDAFLLGENYARSLGVNVRISRLLILVSTSILAGSITAFAGPIAFVGLAVPHLARLLFKTGQHRILFLGTILCGGIILLLCDILCQLPGTETVLPINAITSIIGAPVIIFLLLRKRRSAV
ncbi:iron ABC transporter permease [Flavobacterium silvaticum]|uniref:Iron ABC transporter permease n=1 Tax=Flavobacterium silvaticum TaxID=1852020 RepID=A0A972FMU6_9FLAO|nr:iron ABC transporter permease [Flavobacterium silvaticum]NMH28135.1 iron ABC transporter permease [Flavobacterium silvaticum]